MDLNVLETCEGNNRFSDVGQMAYSFHSGVQTIWNRVMAKCLMLAPLLASPQQAHALMGQDKEFWQMLQQNKNNLDY